MKGFELTKSHLLAVLPWIALGHEAANQRIASNIKKYRILKNLLVLRGFLEVLLVLLDLGPAALLNRFPVEPTQLQGREVLGAPVALGPLVPP